MTNQRFSIQNTIFLVILCPILVALMLWQFITEGIITADNWLAVVCFYSCFIILIFAMTEITYCSIDNHITIKGLKYKTFLLLEENKDRLCSFQNFCVIERKKAIINELALVRMFCGEKYDEDFCAQKYESGDKDYFIKLLRKSKFENKSTYTADVKEFCKTKDMPRHFYQFQRYYTGEMLKNKNSVSGILMTAFSIILGIVSLVSLNAFSLLSFDFWIILISGFLVEIFDTVIIWKSKLRYHAELLTSDYDKLKEDIEIFLAEKQQSLDNTEKN